jgi:hypothetical protein
LLGDKDKKAAVGAGVKKATHLEVIPGAGAGAYRSSVGTTYEEFRHPNLMTEVSKDLNL